MFYQSACSIYGASFPNSCGYCQGQPTGDCMAHTYSSKENLDKREQKQVQNTGETTAENTFFPIVHPCTSFPYARSMWQSWQQIIWMVFDSEKYHLFPITTFPSISRDTTAGKNDAWLLRQCNQWYELYWEEAEITLGLQYSIWHCPIIHNCHSVDNERTYTTR